MGYMQSRVKCISEVLRYVRALLYFGISSARKPPLHIAQPIGTSSEAWCPLYSDLSKSSPQREWME